MKIAIMGDIHENMIAFKKALEDSKKQKVDKYLFLGDYITDGDNPNEILDLVRKYADYAIKGNRENYILNHTFKRKNYANYKNLTYTYNKLNKSNMDYIKSLKDNLLIEIQNKKILMIHADIYYNKYKLDIDKICEKVIEDYPDFDICLLAHSHIFCDKTYKGKRFINPGSIGLPSDTKSSKYCILNIGDTITVELREYSVMEYYSEFEKNYKNTNFYKEHPVWSTLVLDSLKDAASYFGEFVGLTYSKLDRSKPISSKKFNKRWKEAFQEYLNKKDN